MTSRREEIDKLFEGADEFIPLEILHPVKNFLFAVQPKFKLSHEAFKDVVQTCLIKIWAMEDKFKSKPPVYFVGVARNTIRDGFRERMRLLISDAIFNELFSIDEKQMMNDVLRQMYSKGDFDRLIQCALTDQEAAVVILRGEGLTLKQVSGVLELSPSTVKRRYATALEKLRRKLRPVAPERHKENVEIIH